jgi:hypothetical protein
VSTNEISDVKMSLDVARGLSRPAAPSSDRVSQHPGQHLVPGRFGTPLSLQLTKSFEFEAGQTAIEKRQLWVSPSAQSGIRLAPDWSFTPWTDSFPH